METGSRSGSRLSERAFVVCTLDISLERFDRTIPTFRESLVLIAANRKVDGLFFVDATSDGNPRRFE